MTHSDRIPRCDAYYGPAQNKVKTDLLKDTGNKLTAYHNMCTYGTRPIFCLVYMYVHMYVHIYIYTCILLTCAVVGVQVRVRVLWCACAGGSNE